MLISYKESIDIFFSSLENIRQKSRLKHGSYITIIWQTLLSAVAVDTMCPFYICTSAGAIIQHGLHSTYFSYLIWFSMWMDALPGCGAQPVDFSASANENEKKLTLRDRWRYSFLTAAAYPSWGTCTECSGTERRCGPSLEQNRGAVTVEYGSSVY